MAIYSVTTSGVLNFAYTGLGNPVSTFASEGISTGAIASSPIAGNNPKIWTIGPPNYFTSSGGLVVVDYNGGTQSGLAASALGEYPLSGTLDNIPEVHVTLGFVTAVETSHGNLVLSGSTSSIEAYNKTTAGELVLSGNSAYPSLRQFTSNGNLVINGTTVYPSTRQYFTNGNLVIDTNDAYSAILKEPTAGNLVISGTDFVQKAYNKTSSGDLVISTSSVSQIILTESSAGNLVVVDKAYNTLYTGGIADNPIASFPIAAGSSSATVQQVQISFYGNINSSGNLVITSNGEFVEPLSASSGIAGAALADQTIGGGMDTVFRSTGYQTTLDFSTDGNLLISGSAGVNNDYQSSGNLLISGTDSAHRALNFTTDGNLVTNGSTVQSSLRNETTSGDLVITPVGEFIEPLSASSGIAGAALADQTIAGGIDTTYRPSAYQDLWIVESSGNLLISGYSSFNNDYQSSGNLVISGTTTLGKTYNFVTAGNLVVTGSDSQNRTIAEYSSGNLLIFSVITQPLSSSSGIAGAALADQTIAGGQDQLYSEYQDLWNEPTSGNLVVSGSDYQSRTIAETTAGNLAISGTTVVARELDFLSSGNLVITGNDYQSRTIAETTAGNLVITPVGEFIEPLSSSSGIAGSALADQTIAGGKDTNYYTSTYEDLWIELTSGNLSISGTTTQSSLRKETTAGNLVISGTDSQSSLRKESTAGNLVITGTTATNKTLDFVSRGNLVVTPVGWKSIATISGTIAGSAIAGDPISGDEMENNIAVVQVSYISGGTYYPGNVAYTTSAGNLVISGTTTAEFISASNEISSGNLIVTGATAISTTIVRNTAGNLIITGSTVDAHTTAVDTAGELLLVTSSSSSYSVNKNSAGNLLVSGTDTHSSTKTTTSAGNLAISGTTTAEFISGLDIRSHGELVVRGTATAQFIPGQQTATRSGGGSYIFPSSWDILTPYFPDDRHILGYQKGNTEPGNLRIGGFSTVTVISKPKPVRKSLTDYMLDVAAKPVAVQKIDPAEEQRKRIMQLALAEDQLLLSGQLLDFDPIQDELDNELMM